MDVDVEGVDYKAFKYGGGYEPKWFNNMISNEVVIRSYGYCVINYMCEEIRVNINEWILKSKKGKIIIMSDYDFNLEYL